MQTQSSIDENMYNLNNNKDMTEVDNFQEIKMLKEQTQNDSYELK
jgi:hypothetical protein